MIKYLWSLIKKVHPKGGRNEKKDSMLSDINDFSIHLSIFFIHSYS